MIASPADACREFARNVGRENTERAWILTDWDTWELNPFYAGPPVRRPDDDSDRYDFEDRMIEARAEAESSPMVFGDECPF